MPLQLSDLDVIPEVAGLRSALIVPCNMCPAVSVAVRERKPFMRFFRSLLTSAPFQGYIRTLQSQLAEKGVKTKVFSSRLYYHWFICMWTSGQRKRLKKQAGQHEAVIVLGCDSATQTVRDLVASTGCKVVEGMEVIGIMNARMRFHLPCNVSFEDCQIIPMPRDR